MNEPNLPIHGISDTARWVAYFRARESERPDALFHDPYAGRLAGERGFQIATLWSMETSTTGHGWRARIFLTRFFCARFKMALALW